MRTLSRLSRERGWSWADLTFPAPRTGSERGNKEPGDTRRGEEELEDRGEGASEAEGARGN